MFTSVNRLWGKRALRWLIVTMFCAFFGAVYELFGHGVYSYAMIYTFAVPMVLGVLPCIIMMLRKETKEYSISVFLWSCGVITLTVGCAFKGVLEIYGTTSALMIVYPVAGAALLVSAFICRFRKGV